MTHPNSRSELGSRAQLVETALSFLNSCLVGHDSAVRRAFLCLVARGHLLIEDVPGVGKTTLARAMAELFGLQFHRLQMTNDLLPSDILGGPVFDPNTREFVVRKGPLFAEFVLADELNRASPRTQSAMLEAMAEGQVSFEGVTWKLPEPFVFVATQNPLFQSGTQVLPESQLDRFLMRISLGFPSEAAELELLQKGRVVPLRKPQFSKQDLLQLQSHAETIHLSETTARYIHSLLRSTRGSRSTGVSPRGGLALGRAARAEALLQGRDFVLPEDVQAVAASVLAHRWANSEIHHHEAEQQVEELVTKVPIPKLV